MKQLRKEPIMGETGSRKRREPDVGEPLTIRQAYVRGRGRPGLGRISPREGIKARVREVKRLKELLKGVEFEQYHHYYPTSGGRAPRDEYHEDKHRLRDLERKYREAILKEIEAIRRLGGNPDKELSEFSGWAAFGLIVLAVTALGVAARLFFW